MVENIQNKRKAKHKKKQTNKIVEKFIKDDDATKYYLMRFETRFRIAQRDSFSFKQRNRKLCPTDWSKWNP